jgi:hypothetical protein
MDTIHKKAATTLGPVECSIGRPPTFDVSPADMHVEAQWLRIRVAQDMEAAGVEARNHNLQAAREHMQRSMNLVSESPNYLNGTPQVMALMTDAQDVMRGFASAEQYRSLGSHMVETKGTMLRRQRCMESSEASANTFRSTKKAFFAKAFKKTHDKK